MPYKRQTTGVEGSKRKYRKSDKSDYNDEDNEPERASSSGNNNYTILINVKYRF
jgi:hypothetical protein